jgi:hypothetical protein
MRDKTVSKKKKRCNKKKLTFIGAGVVTLAWRAIGRTGLKELPKSMVTQYQKKKGFKVKLISRFCGRCHLF